MDPLPLFPLPTVLYPGALLPLHNFEPRYREMLADCLEGDRRFGLLAAVAADPGNVGCIASIRVAAPLTDGRSNIVVLGEARFELLEVMASDRPYLLGLVRQFEDVASSAPAAEDLILLRQLADRYREVLRILNDGTGREGDWSDDAVPLSFEVSALLQAPFEVRLRLLTTRSTAARVRALIDLFPTLLREAGARAEVHLRAPTNGRGGEHHEIIADG
jgi:Lon protease-like protein